MLETFVGYLGPKSNKATENIFWSSDIPSFSGRQRQYEINPGGNHAILLGRAKHIETIEDAFDLLFDEEMFSLIESKTNEKIRKRTETLTKHKEHLFESSMFPRIKPTNIFELRVLIGLLYFRGLFGINHHSLNILFSDKAGPPVFSVTMSLDRVNFLLSTLTTLKLIKRNGHMITLQLHVQYLKCSILTHLNTCYLHYTID